MLLDLQLGVVKRQGFSETVGHTWTAWLGLAVSCGFTFSLCFEVLEPVTSKGCALSVQDYADRSHERHEVRIETKERVMSICEPSNQQH